MKTKGIRIWITGEVTKWDDNVPLTLAERCETILAAAFAELIDEGVIDISTDELDVTEVEDEDAV